MGDGITPTGSRTCSSPDGKTLASVPQEIVDLVLRFAHKKQSAISLPSLWSRADGLPPRLIRTSGSPLCRHDIEWFTEHHRFSSLLERHDLHQMAAGVGRVVSLGDAEVSDRPRCETTGVAFGGRRDLVVTTVGEHLPSLAVKR